MDIDEILTDLRRDGWATANGKPADLSSALARHGYRSAHTQRGAARQILRPLKIGDAPPRSMSARYGLDAQPLHSDGAHLRVPPDVVVLAAAEPNSTPTMLWSATFGGVSEWHPEFAQYGTFTVRNGRDSFLAPAAEGARVRVDPACMSPADGYARQAEEYFQALPTIAHQWSLPDTLLIINNRLCLHARGAIVSGDEERALERLTFQWSDIS
ncbi:hypothetical protein [uncultured Microbacterium sp.]|uniref:hypothetical protein n=1 Tax=uncultured Microbacterium sp. TaxID=191216 RepID=UPI0025D6F2EF|nr:hypothetical protein [uncultured Microbacterium sp.]